MFIRPKVAILSAVIFSILAIFSLTAFSEPTTQPDDPPLTLEAKVVPGTCLAGGIAEFKVRVKNSSKTPQFFFSPTCGWGAEFQSNEPLLTPIIQKCRQNELEKISLAPGEAWEKLLRVGIDQNIKPGFAHLKLGFTPPSSETTIWSDVLEIEVKQGTATTAPSTQPDDLWHGTLVIEARPEPGPYLPGGEIKFTVRVKNTSKNAQTFNAMSCSWPGQWKFSTITFAWPGSFVSCRMNAPRPVTLDAGEAWEKTLKSQIAKDATPGSVKFKLGFTPINTNIILWSNEVQLDIAAPKQ